MEVMKRSVCVLLILFLIVPLLIAQNKATNDDRIYDEVRTKLANDEDVRGGALDVTVKNGAVTITGAVHTQKAREKAERIVKKIKGVTSVTAKLTLIDEK
jgi:osmotically-inducible protein OsmY